MRYGFLTRRAWQTLLVSIIPVAFLFWLYSDGLKTWFVDDDFAWLGLLREVRVNHDLFTQLFAPAAQGTIRPWSERGFFLLFESLFGLDSLPFRIWVFATMSANLVLLSCITRRITGSTAAGMFAAILWAANSALSTVMAWTSAYNEALCALFLMSALVLFLRYAESGRRVFWWWQLVVFTLGFGALEINVVYPALAAAWVVFLAPVEKRRRLLVSLTPLFVISVIYFFVHSAFAPIPGRGPYAVHFDARLFQTLAEYSFWSLRSWGWKNYGHSVIAGIVVFCIPAVALAAFWLREISKRRYLGLFCISWFLITIAPTLPLPDHRTGYYLTIPVAGLAMLGGWGISRAIDAGFVWQVAALLPLVVYLAGMIPLAKQSTRWWRDRTGPVRGLVLGVKAAQESNPGKTIVMEGISPDLFKVFPNAGFFPTGVDHVYLTPTEGDRLRLAVKPDDLASFVIYPEPLRNAITHDQVVIYSDVGDHLRNITEVWERSNPDLLSPNQRPDQVPRRVEVGNPLLAYLLGPEWLPVEASGFRWMPGRATVRLGGPRTAKDKLLLEGFCPEQQLSAGVLHLSVSVDGIPLPITQIGNPESNFRRLMAVPPSLVGRDSVVVVISVDRVLHDSPGRQLGLVFGTIAFQPE
jgi:hypothetical protein